MDPKSWVRLCFSIYSVNSAIYSRHVIQSPGGPSIQLTTRNGFHPANRRLGGVRGGKGRVLLTLRARPKAFVPLRSETFAPNPGRSENLGRGPSRVAGGIVVPLGKESTGRSGRI